MDLDIIWQYSLPSVAVVELFVFRDEPENQFMRGNNVILIEEK